MFLLAHVVQNVDSPEFKMEFEDSDSKENLE